MPIEGRLVAALIHAGPGAVLSHATAAWWWELMKDEPSTIDVSAPGYSSSTTGVRVHHPRHRDATTHRRFPITTVPRTLLDLAASTTLNRVRVALAQADYRRILDVAAVESILGHGRSGSAKLRRALEHHQPRLALTRSGLEIAFFSLCEAARLPVPEVNARVDGWEVDVLWREHRLAVEVDGGRNHSTRGQIERDRRKELHLRAGGFQVIRYTDRQVADEPEIVASDVRRALNLTAGLDHRHSHAGVVQLEARRLAHPGHVALDSERAVGAAELLGQGLEAVERPRSQDQPIPGLPRVARGGGADATRRAGDWEYGI